MRKSEELAWKAIATAGGLGYVPRAPGTAGAAGGLVVAFLLLRYTSHPWLVMGILILLFTGLGVVASNRLAPLWGKDPQKIVIDEVAGMWIGLLGTGTGWFPLASSFLLFRFFDIVKPLGIRRAEHLPGGIGVMADDILAGLYTNVTVRIILCLTPSLA